MTDTASAQVREYTSHVVATVEPIEMREILDRPSGEGPVRPIGRPVYEPPRWRASVAVATAVVGIVTLGLIPWILGSRASDGPANEPAKTTVTTTAQNRADVVTTPGTFDETTPSDLPIGSSVQVGTETSIGTLEWIRIQGGANSCPPTVRVDDVRGGYYSTWCHGGAMYSKDGISWSDLADFPEYDATNAGQTAHRPPALDAEPPTVPVSFRRGATHVTQNLFFFQTDFGWVASQPRWDPGHGAPTMWISTDGYEWEEVEIPEIERDGRPIWSGTGGGAGDLLYFGYVTEDYETGNYLWIGHFASE